MDYVLTRTLEHTEETEVVTKYTIVHTEEAEGGFSGRCLELPGAISQGETLEELERKTGTINVQTQQKI
jgi:hypothetical protein